MTTRLEIADRVVSLLNERYDIVVDSDHSKPHGLDMLVLVGLEFNAREDFDFVYSGWDFTNTESINDIVDLIERSIY